jgi:hypothetical protein
MELETSMADLGELLTVLSQTRKTRKVYVEASALSSLLRDHGRLLKLAKNQDPHIYIIQRLVGMEVLAACNCHEETILWLQARPGNRGEIQVIRFCPGDGFHAGVVITHHIEQEAWGG